VAKKLMELGNNLEIWEAEPNELREQDKNARVMSNAAMNRLVKTIERDNRLETLPFCVFNKKGGLEIVSGHHRVRAAKMANIEKLYVVADTSKLSYGEIKAKQLAHNSIQGYDDPDTLRELYESIDTVESRLEAFIDLDELDRNLKKASSQVVDMGLEYRTVVINFFPSDKDKFVRACEQIEYTINPNSEQYLAELERIELMKTLISRVEDDYDVHAFGVVFGIMGRIVLEHMGKETNKDWIPFKDIFDVTGVPKSVAESIQNKLNGNEPKWKQIQKWAENYGK
jgi:hypothetical protein